MTLSSLEPSRRARVRERLAAGLHIEDDSEDIRLQIVTLDGDLALGHSVFTIVSRDITVKGVESLRQQIVTGELVSYPFWIELERKAFGTFRETCSRICLTGSSQRRRFISIFPWSRTISVFKHQASRRSGNRANPLGLRV
jgi:hypothetical protein